MTGQDGLMDQDELLFAEEEETDLAKEVTIEQDPWVVLIVDDEKQIHQVTKMVLQDFEFDGKKTRIP